MYNYDVYEISDIIKESRASPKKFVDKCEKQYESTLDALAGNLAKGSSQAPVVLLSGPSGSGKTTTCLKLEERLDGMEYETHSISLDNYFHPITAEERPLFEANLLDLESPDRVDRELLNSQLSDLLAGKEVEIPHFDFITNTRQKSGRSLKLRKGEIIILEGIHSLNPQLIENAASFSHGVYVSVRSRIEYKVAGESFLLHPSKVRLARRMIRDKRTRNRNPSAVVAIYDSVERGENKYIMPYKHLAATDIDTFFPYEMALYKGLLPSSLPEDEAKYPWLTELFEVLSKLPAVDPRHVPHSSLLREFIGGGKYGD
jgi:uridine kinase